MLLKPFLIEHWALMELKHVVANMLSCEQKLQDLRFLIHAKHTKGTTVNFPDIKLVIVMEFPMS